MIVVTGGSGFIGTHVCSLLAGEGHAVRIIDIVPPPMGVNAEFVRASVLDVARLQRLFAGAEGVVHLAALVDVSASVADPFPDFQVNLEGTLNVLEAARSCKVPKVAYASSAAVYGDPEEIPIPESHPPAPLSPYGLSKLSAERYVLMYNALYGMENVALRLFNVYGPGQKASSPYSGVVTKFSEALAEGKQPTIFGDGEQTRDFVHADDVAGAFLRALSCGGCESAVNIGSGREITINELLGRMCAISGAEFSPKNAPARRGEIRRSCASITFAKKKLGYYPRISLEQGLGEVMAQKD